MNQIYIDRFWQRVKKTNSCWNWIGSRAGLHKNYGNISDGKKSIFAHRFSYLIHKGEIPKGLVIDHLCRNTLCVNPAHLEAVTHRENLLRGIGPTAINYKKTHCIRGHEYTVKNTTYKPNGTRKCIICNKIRSNNWYQKQPREKNKKIRTHCESGKHLWNENNLLFKKGKKGIYPYCKICRNERRKEVSFHKINS